MAAVSSPNGLLLLMRNETVLEFCSCRQEEVEGVEDKGLFAGKLFMCHPHLAMG